MGKIFETIGGLVVVIAWVAIGEAIAVLLMREIISRIDSSLSRLWGGEDFPRWIGALVIIVAAFVTMILGPALLLVPLARQRVRELVCYYARRWA